VSEFNTELLLQENIFPKYKKKFPQNWRWRQCVVGVDSEWGRGHWAHAAGYRSTLLKPRCYAYASSLRARYDEDLHENRIGNTDGPRIRW